jgi:hypothetical protein
MFAFVFMISVLDFSIFNDIFLLKNDTKEYNHVVSYNFDSICNTLMVGFIIFYRIFKIFCAYKLDLNK